MWSKKIKTEWWKQQQRKSYLNLLRYKFFLVSQWPFLQSPFLYCLHILPFSLSISYIFNNRLWSTWLLSLNVKMTRKQKQFALCNKASKFSVLFFSISSNLEIVTLAVYLETKKYRCPHKRERLREGIKCFKYHLKKQSHLQLFMLYQQSLNVWFSYVSLNLFFFVETKTLHDERLSHKR